MSELTVSVVASAHRAREEFEAEARAVLREAIGKLGPSPFSLRVDVANVEITRLGDSVRAYTYQVHVRAEIGDGF